ncbi:LysM peptidoglycan-binding domain-containing protein [Flavobacterium caseinilyticum]|uniref:LysM peptidoglycan-binding domain-containing protein n=1 Tax=Flavobacterium caseinilyticum TaxID=2541732 RepID=A0A4R5B1E6_9FLAO|nr:LysM peptidoglycan-binding domain-containing protein [Flavobacterium caseinilyticum]TDD78833.1 LysM peptidoglycan-binding domain-containing protein [Flavobacterium caseinilyticum]
MRYVLILVFVFLNSITAFSQENYKKHTVSKGETISEIAEKYDVKIKDIYKLNTNAKNLLKLNSVLLIPIIQTKSTKTASRTKTNIPATTHEILAKETLYGLSKQYGVTVEELNQANPSLASSELQIGQKINIPANAIPTEKLAVLPAKQTSSNKGIVKQVNEPAPSETFTWEVLPQETKYSITKKYGITIKEFDKANPNLGVKALRVGQKINIPGTLSVNAETALLSVKTTDLPKVAIKNDAALPVIAAKTEEAVDSKSNLVLNGTESKILVQTTTSENSVPLITVREVLPKETKYAIAKQYGITVQELERQNPEIKKALPVGYKLNIATNKLPSESVAFQTNFKIEDSTNRNEQNRISENNSGEFKTNLKPTFSHDFLDQLIDHASENIGSRYRTGGMSKSGFDCSGLMCTTFGAFDIKLPRTSREQSSIGTKINTEEAQKGDLIFFKTNGRSQINHVGMVVEVCEGEIKFIHSSVSNGVIISSTKEKYYEKNFSQINRVLQ